MSLNCAGGGSDHPPYCFRRSSKLSWAPFCDVVAGLCVFGLGGSFRETMGFPRAARAPIGLKGLPFCRLTTPFGLGGPFGEFTGGEALMLMVVLLQLKG